MRSNSVAIEGLFGETYPYANKKPSPQKQRAQYTLSSAKFQRMCRANRNYKSLCRGLLLYQIGSKNISRRAAEPQRARGWFLHRVQASRLFIRGGQANLASSRSRQLARSVTRSSRAPVGSFATELSRLTSTNLPPQQKTNPTVAKTHRTVI